MDQVTEVLLGNLSTELRIWTALAPAIILAAYFIGGMAVYAVLTRFRGQFVDGELETRADRGFIGLWVRLYFAWVMQPLWHFVRWSGIPASAVTTLSMLLAAASGVSLAAGRFALGGWLYIFSGILDFLDGRLARAMGQQSKRGAALDSVLDRYSDTVVLAGLAWYYRESWVLLPVLAALGGSMLTSYVRARGEGLGIDIKIGMMQRPERITFLGMFVAFSPIVAALRTPDAIYPMHWLAVFGIVFLAISTQLTAARRFRYLLNALSEDEPSAGALHGGKGGLPRSVVSALVATAADFAVVAALVSTLGMSPWSATALGCGVGAIVNFVINRIWAFDTGGAATPQAFRYGFVSVTSMLLNAGGVAIMVLPGVDYRLAWVIVRLAVFLGWNFPLHRDYVFGPPTPLDRGRRGVA